MAVAIRNSAATEGRSQTHDVEDSAPVHAQRAVVHRVFPAHMAHRMRRVLRPLRPQGLQRFPYSAVVLCYCRGRLCSLDLSFLGHHHDGQSGRNDGFARRF